MKKLFLFVCGIVAAVLLPPVVQFMFVVWDVFQPPRRKARRIY